MPLRMAQACKYSSPSLKKFKGRRSLPVSVLINGRALPVFTARLPSAKVMPCASTKITRNFSIRSAERKRHLSNCQPPLFKSRKLCSCQLRIAYSRLVKAGLFVTKIQGSAQSRCQIARTCAGSLPRLIKTDPLADHRPPFFTSLYGCKLTPSTLILTVFGTRNR